MKKQDDFLEKIICDIEGFNVQKLERSAETKNLELRAHKWLMSKLKGGIGTLFIRNITYALNINEHRVFRWRLDNKYMQYLILSYYAPKCMPKTISLSKILKSNNGVSKIRELFNKGFFLKKTLGHNSGKTDSFDRTAEFGKIIKHFRHNNSCQEEKWVLQKKLSLNNEYRIHTFSKDIIFGLTFKTGGVDSSNNKFKAEQFVKVILEKLPGAILQGSLIAWDIGLTNNAKYYVIEANFTGFHPEHNYGFQTSGYFQDDIYGPVICAWVNNYLKTEYKISFNTIENSFLSSLTFFRKLLYYTSILENRHFEAAKYRTKDTSLSAVIYLGDSANSYIVTLIIFFCQVKFAELYYVIVKEDCLLGTNNLFGHLDQIKVITEDMLFKKYHYQLIKLLSNKKRSKICCHNAIKLTNKKPYIII